MPGQAFIGIDVRPCSHCDTPSAGEGPGGSHGRSPTVRSICVGDAAAPGPFACGGDGSLTGASARMDQLGIRGKIAQKDTALITVKHALKTKLTFTHSEALVMCLTRLVSEKWKCGYNFLLIGWSISLTLFLLKNHKPFQILFYFRPNRKSL